MLIAVCPGSSIDKGQAEQFRPPGTQICHKHIRRAYQAWQSSSVLTPLRWLMDDLGDYGPRPASTLVGVAALALPDWLLEIEAVAILHE